MHLFFLNIFYSTEVFYFFLHLLSCEFIRNGFQQLRLLSIGFDQVGFSGWSRLALLKFNPGLWLLFGFFLFLTIFLHVFQEAVSALRVLNMFNTHSYSLAKSLALHLFVYNANSMLGNTVDSSSVAMVTFMGPSFVNSTHSLDVLQCHLSCKCMGMWSKEQLQLSKRPESTYWVSLLFPCVFVFLANSWKMAVPAERKGKMTLTAG